MATETTLTVRYAETDMMGIVHHSRYYPWFEVARTDFIKQTGMTYTQMEKDGILLPLAESGAKYLKGLLYEDNVVIVARLAELRVSRCRFEYEVFRVNNGERELCSTGFTMHAFTSPDFKPLNLKKKAPQLWEKMLSLVEN